MNDSVTTVKDVMPTLLEMAGIEHPGGGMYRSRRVHEMQGRSLLPLLTGEVESIRKPTDYMGWELFGKRALRQGDWKIIYVPSHESRDDRLPVLKSNQWQLYNLKNDPVESVDLVSTHPEKLEEMLSLWEHYKEENGVIYPDKLSGY